MKKITRYIFYSAGKIFVAQGTSLREYKYSMKRYLCIKKALLGRAA